MKKRKAIIFFIGLLLMVVGYVVWALHPAPITEKDFIFHKNLSSEEQKAARMYIQKKPPEAPFFFRGQWMWRLRYPYESKRQTVLVAPMGYSDGSEFIMLTYPDHDVHLQVSSDGSYQEVDINKTLLPIAQPLVGRLFESKAARELRESKKIERDAEPNRVTK